MKIFKAFLKTILLFIFTVIPITILINHYFEISDSVKILLGLLEGIVIGLYPFEKWIADAFNLN